MASENGAGQDERRKPKKVKRRKLRYFFLNGKLHKSLHINRSSDTITAWCYPDHCRVAYTYSDVLRRKETAFTTIQVAKMLNRSRLTVERAILRGDIEEPQSTYGLTEVQKKFQYLWCEKDIIDAHAYFQTVHRGRPRKDGLVTPVRMPSPRELRALIRQEEIMYVKRGDEFVPTFAADDML